MYLMAASKNVTKMSNCIKKIDSSRKLRKNGFVGNNKW